MMKHSLLIILSLFIFTNLHAGMFELSAQSSFKDTNVNGENGSEARSVSGSISYYFWQAGALEYTYMQGYSFSKGRIDSSTTYEQVMNYNYGGLDFVYNFGTKQSTFNPYIKAGMAEISKELQYKQNGTSITPQKSSGKNMTYGAGIKVKVTQTLSFRVSYDIWKGPIDDDDIEATTDSSLKMGLSWYL